jgi:hypothetical protein
MISSRLPSDANAHKSESMLRRAPPRGAMVHEGPPLEAHGGPAGSRHENTASMSTRVCGSQGEREFRELLVELEVALDAHEIEGARSVAERLWDLVARSCC